MLFVVMDDFITTFGILSSLSLQDPPIWNGILIVTLTIETNVCSPPCNRQMLITHMNILSGWYGFSAIFCWLHFQAHTWILRNKFQPVNWNASRIEFCSSNLWGLLAKDCLLEPVASYWDNPHQTYKSLSHIFCDHASNSFVYNITPLLGILHWKASSFYFRLQGTSLSP